MAKTIPKNKYRVWFKQINQCYLDVEAFSEDAATMIARRKWEKENIPDVGDIKLIEESKTRER